MLLAFRQRIFLILAALTAVPTVLGVIGWALAARADAPPAGARVSLEQMAVSAREMLAHMDTARLEPAERAAVRRHLDQVSNALTLARRADTYFRYYAGGFLAVVLVLGGLILFAAVRLAGHLSRQLSRPIDELVGWTRLIRRRLPLPAGPPTRGAPEFEALRQALRELAAAIDAAHKSELEAERLRAFREVARRVAHEIKNPLTAMRIALDQLGRYSRQGPQRAAALEVLEAETERLDRLAREFADFGRLPEGPQSEVDVVELIEELGRTAIPESVRVAVSANGGRRTVLGHYEALRRAFANLLRNAAEAMAGRGTIEVGVAGREEGLIVTVADHGPGIPPDHRGRVFEPYFTTKADGTGLGLALVRQTLDALRATVQVDETPGGGATFTLVFPE
ncbi:MAG TPA: HAMP domain-containing sensor histidine kinase [Gemmatimonadales bacterium]|nr:HAMP domain-containing sensor histidine kinase [Gemmatimonadales bacterium]